jgi:hypothetical protein
MERSLRIRVRIETILAIVGAALSVLTLLWPEWIEEIFGVEPDGGNGSLEWIIALGFLAVGVGLGLLARHDQRKLRNLAITA